MKKGLYLFDGKTINSSLLIHLHANCSISFLVDSLDFFWVGIPCKFSSEFQSWSKDNSDFEFFIDEFKICFNFLKTVEVCVFGYPGKVTLNMMDHLWCLDSLGMRISALDFKFIDEFFYLLWIWVNYRDNMVSKGVTMNKNLSNQAWLLIGSFQLLRDNILTLGKLKNVFDSVDNFQFVLFCKTSHITSSEPSILIDSFSC